MDNEIVILVYMSLIFGSISFVMSIVLFLKLKDLDNRVWMDGIKNESNIKNSQYDIYKKIDREIESVDKRIFALNAKFGNSEEILEKLISRDSYDQQNPSHSLTEDPIHDASNKIYILTQNQLHDAYGKFGAYVTNEWISYDTNGLRTYILTEEKLRDTCEKLKEYIEEGWTAYEKDNS